MEVWKGGYVCVCVCVCVCLYMHIQVFPQFYEDYMLKFLSKEDLKIFIKCII
jgi:hypothetical protein